MSSSESSVDLGCKIAFETLSLVQDAKWVLIISFLPFAVSAITSDAARSVVGTRTPGEADP